MIPDGVLAGLLPAVLLAVCSFSPLAAGLRIADDHSSARESEGRVRVRPDEDFDERLIGPYEGGPFNGEPDTHVYRFEKNVTTDARRYHNFPRNGRVAVVLRGASFRNRDNKGVFCADGDEQALKMQKAATESLVENVIVPLEKAGNTVDVIVTDHQCPLSRPGGALISWMGQRVKAVEQSDESRDQNRNILFALDLLANNSGGTPEAVAAKYSHVLVMRHDTHWVQPMSDWLEADWSKVLFPFKCPGWKKRVGVHDLFALVPAEYYTRYYKTVNLRHCFKGADGHDCLIAMVWHTQSEESVDTAVHYDGKNVTLPWFTYGKARAVC